MAHFLEYHQVSSLLQAQHDPRDLCGRGLWDLEYKASLRIVKRIFGKQIRHCSDYYVGKNLTMIVDSARYYKLRTDTFICSYPDSLTTFKLKFFLFVKKEKVAWYMKIPYASYVFLMRQIVKKLTIFELKKESRLLQNLKKGHTPTFAQGDKVLIRYVRMIAQHEVEYEV